MSEIVGLRGTYMSKKKRNNNINLANRGTYRGPKVSVYVMKSEPLKCNKCNFNLSKSVFPINYNN